MSQMTLLLHWLASLPRRMIGKPVLQPALDQMDTGHNGDNHLMVHQSFLIVLSVFILTLCLAPEVQFFEWESLPPPGISWWKHFENEVPRLASLGCTQVWLPRERVRAPTFLRCLFSTPLISPQQGDGQGLFLSFLIELAA